MGFIKDAYNNVVDSVSGLWNTGKETVEDITNGVMYTVPDSTLKQDQYDFTYRAFPNDLGNSNIGHYMVININVPVNLTGSSARTSINADINTRLEEFSKVDVLRFNKDVPSYGANPRGQRSIPRYTRRIKESIALFMPSPLVYTTLNDYSDINLTPLMGGVVGGLLSDAVSVATGVTGGAGSATATAVSNIVSAAPKLAGYPINPRVEVLFSNTKLRQFQFEVLMAPRNLKESQTIQEIIKSLRYYAAPELGGGLGITWIPPAEFDITFYNKGKENTMLPRINTCVLDVIDVDYAPHSGIYSTFSNGHPVSVRLALKFTELEVNHKLRVLQGF
jgi:hypothetical protein